MNGTRSKTKAASDAAEVSELKQMFRGGSPSRRKAASKPDWDSSPMRSCPPALKGLKPATREPWAIDEEVYNRRFETRDVGIQDRYLDETARRKTMDDSKFDYLARFENKYVAIDKYDGNPMT